MGVPTYWSKGDQNAFELLPENSLITDIKGFIVLVNNIDEVKPHYQKLFGQSSSNSKNELHYQLETNIVQVIQPASNTPYDIILKDRGEGVQILIAAPRYISKDINDEVFKLKGFNIENIDKKNTLYISEKMPFQIQINL